MTIADVITTFSAVVAAMSFVSGVSAWRREYVGRRRIELAETVLAKFYEAADVIRDARSPHGWTDEGLSRQRQDNERPEETQSKNRAHVLFERLNKHRGLFAELQSLKYRFMATFGKSALEPFKELVSVRNDMIIAANTLGDYLWPREARGELTRRDAEDKRKYEKIFWSAPAQANDAITQRVAGAVEKVEDLLQQELRSRIGPWRRAARWCEYVRTKFGHRSSSVPGADGNSFATDP